MSHFDRTVRVIAQGGARCSAGEKAEESEEKRVSC